MVSQFQTLKSLKDDTISSRKPVQQQQILYKRMWPMCRAFLREHVRDVVITTADQMIGYYMWRNKRSQIGDIINSRKMFTSQSSCRVSWQIMRGSQNICISHICHIRTKGRFETEDWSLTSVRRSWFFRKLYIFYQNAIQVTHWVNTLFFQW